MFRNRQTDTDRQTDFGIIYLKLVLSRKRLSKTNKKQERINLPIHKRTKQPKQKVKTKTTKNRQRAKQTLNTMEGRGGGWGGGGPTEQELRKIKD